MNELIKLLLAKGKGKGTTGYRAAMLAALLWLAREQNKTNEVLQAFNLRLATVEANYVKR